MTRFSVHDRPNYEPPEDPREVEAREEAMAEKRATGIRDCLACFWDEYKRENPRATIHQLDPSEHPDTWEIREGDTVLFGHLGGNPRVCYCAIRAKYDRQTR